MKHSETTFIVMLGFINKLNRIVLSLFTNVLNLHISEKDDKVTDNVNTDTELCHALTDSEIN